jgi:anaerobic dimethyl sulfoxide reductase subunit B (iron-sulfur subunit)
VSIVFHFNPSRCSGCYTCVVACKDWHDIAAGPVFLRRLVIRETGRYPKVSVSFLSIACHHCAAPACIAACPAGAISKRESDGIVVVDSGVCLGRDRCGGACLIACPFGAPQFGTEPDARMQKCDLCRERWAEGRKPVCVEACPMRALDAGPEPEMAAKYGAAV